MVVKRIIAPHVSCMKYRRDDRRKFVSALKFQGQLSSRIRFNHKRSGASASARSETSHIGTGTIIDCEGDGDDMKVRVRFETTGVGTKLLIASYLEPF